MVAIIAVILATLLDTYQNRQYTRCIFEMSLRLQSSTHTQQPPRKTNKMLWNRAFFLSSLLLVSDASPLTHSNHVRSKEVTWAPCGLEDIPESVQCGNLIVPMGYTEPDPIETIDLQMLNVPALHEPSKGSILFSFGGSGLGHGSLWLGLGRCY
jgi:hypothetical protein